MDLVVLLVGIKEPPNPSSEGGWRCAEGVAKEVKGAARDVYGQARESAGEVTDSVSDAVTKTASSFERVLRKTIEAQPYTALLIGIGIGRLLGRSPRQKSKPDRSTMAAGERLVSGIAVNL